MEEKLKQRTSSCKKVVLFGPESTGKTTLAKQLAQHYNTLWVPEFSRAYAEEKLSNNKELTRNDVLPIAIGQMKLENSCLERATTVVFCDTNLLETKIYSEMIYNGFCPVEVDNYARSNTYDLYILTATDLPWEKDPVRGVIDKRDLMFIEFKKILESFKLPYITVSGNKDKRLTTAIEHVDALLSS